MKVVCVKNLGFQHQLTYGKKYDIIEWTPNKMAAYIINDQDKESIYPINFFVYKEEWRDIQLKEIGI